MGKKKKNLRGERVCLYLKTKIACIAMVDPFFNRVYPDNW